MSICSFFYLWNLFGVGVFQRSMLNCRREGWGQSAMSICSFFYLWNLFGVGVFQRSMLDWWRGWDQSAMSICSFFYLWILFGVGVFQRSMLDWWRGWDQSAMGICSLFYYVKCIQCSGVPEIYDWLLMGSRCGRAVLTLAQLARGPLWCIEREIERDKTWAVNIIWISVLGICALYYMWNLFSVMVCQRSMLNWRGVNMGCTLHLKICPRYMCIHCSICETYLV